MKVINADGVNQALRMMVAAVRDRDGWISTDPRGMETMEWHTPVTTTYSRPWRRVLFSAHRDANPFFHLFEALWMLAGRNDAAFLDQFTTNFSRYAEADGNLHGAYGWRWRGHFGLHSSVNTPIMGDLGSRDQLTVIARMFAEEPNTRRAVLCMWDPNTDLDADKRDIPCNTQAYFKLRDGKLHMTVTCRSNDIVLGCYGANAVHFSVLHEYMAAVINESSLNGVVQGTYTHVSDSWHYYTSNPFIRLIHDGVQMDYRDYYQPGGAAHQVRTLALVNGTVADWDNDLAQFMGDDWASLQAYSDVFFTDVAWPMRKAHEQYKNGELDSAIGYANKIASTDWKIACVEWLERRRARREVA